MNVLLYYLSFIEQTEECSRHNRRSAIESGRARERASVRASTIWHIEHKNIRQLNWWPTKINIKGLKTYINFVLIQKITEKKIIYSFGQTVDEDE